MELTNEKVINAPRPRVYDALHDAQILRQAIPGCQALSKVAADEYQLTVALKVGPIKTTFSGTLTLYNEDKPAGYSMRGQGHGSAGSAEGHAHVALAAIDATTTNLAYHITADLEGQVSTLESAVVDAAARAMAAEFFSRLTLILENHIPVMAALSPREVPAEPEAAEESGEPEDARHETAMAGAAFAERAMGETDAEELSDAAYAQPAPPGSFFPIPLSERVEAVESVDDAEEYPHEEPEEVASDAHFPEDEATRSIEQKGDVITVGGSRTDDLGAYRDTVPGAHGGFDPDPHYGTPTPAPGEPGAPPPSGLQTAAAGSGLALERDHTFGRPSQSEPVNEEVGGPLRFVWRAILISLGLVLIYLLLTGGV